MFQEDTVREPGADGGGSAPLSTWYRKISFSDTAPHTSEVLLGDRPLSRWESLSGGSPVDAFVPVPDRQPENGRAFY